MFGEELYTADSLNKRQLASHIFGNPERLGQVNAIIHPEVNRHFLAWVERLNTLYVVGISSGYIHFVPEILRYVSFITTVLSSDVSLSENNGKDKMNKMVLAGARMLSVEEASHYAGGFDDPARLVASFAGVAPGVSTNGISIHGNAPHLLQWRLEDVEIPNPNYFADITSLGGGILSSLSSQVLKNSDFFTGAFSSKYGNAVSGVFDMKLRNAVNNTMGI